VNEHQNDTGGVNNWSPVIVKMCEWLGITPDGPKGGRNRIAVAWGNLKRSNRVNREDNTWVVVKCEWKSK
jgi:hypothetical protein